MKARIQTPPDIPELTQALEECSTRIHTALHPILESTDHNVFINALFMSTMTISTLMCDTDQHVDEVIDCICTFIKTNVPEVKALIKRRQQRMREKK